MAAAQQSAAQHKEQSEHPGAGPLVDYARVSTTEKNLHLQQDALQAAGCTSFEPGLSQPRRVRAAGTDRGKIFIVGLCLTECLSFRGKVSPPFPGKVNVLYDARCAG